MGFNSGFKGLNCCGKYYDKRNTNTKTAPSDEIKKHTKKTGGSNKNRENELSVDKYESIYGQL
jgi:hypothetical protein